jgi:hypothetical protein
LDAAISEKVGHGARDANGPSQGRELRAPTAMPADAPKAMIVA